MRFFVLAAFATFFVGVAADYAAAQSWKSNPTNSYYSSQSQQDRSYSNKR